VTTFAVDSLGIIYFWNSGGKLCWWIQYAHITCTVWSDPSAFAKCYVVVSPTNGWAPDTLVDFLQWFLVADFW